MSRDSSATHLHLHFSSHADLLESFTHPSTSSLPAEEIYIPHHLQPLNPEDEDDVVPDQHAAFGIQRATQKSREPAWRDLGLEELARRGREGGLGSGGVNGMGGGGGRENGVSGLGGGARMGGAGAGGGMLGRDEPVVLALRRRPGAGAGLGAAGMGDGVGQVQGGGDGGGAGNGLPR
jgi:hypothetical protein